MDKNHLSPFFIGERRKSQRYLAEFEQNLTWHEICFIYRQSNDIMRR